MLVPWLAPSLFNIDGTHVTAGLCVHFPLTMKRHKATHLQRCLSTSLHWVLYYRCRNATFETSRAYMWGKKETKLHETTTKYPKFYSCFFRLDFSVVELLDIFSPISAPELSKLSTRRPKTLQRRSTLTAPKPLGRTLLTPAGPYRQHTKQDLEESQILEDIFFIC